MTTSPNIPDGISFAQLQEFAKSSTSKKKTTLWDGKTQAEVIKIADKHIQEALSECSDPMVHKAMAIMILKNFLDWHRSAAQECLEKGDASDAAQWMQDAGEILCTARTLLNLEVSHADFDPVSDS